MKAIRIHKHGGPEVLKIEDIPEPQPGPGEVLVKVVATSLNHMDLWVRQGIPGIGDLPLTLGCDGSGVVHSLGEGAHDFKPGDRVFFFPLLSCGTCRFCAQGLVNHCPGLRLFGEHVNGTHSEFFCVAQKNLLKLADNISFTMGAAFPLVFLTAWHMLVTNAQLAQGDDVLVVAAASGVGTAAVQIAKHFGARVIATVGSEEKERQVRALGADVVINHKLSSISARVKEITQKKGVDIVFEHVGEKVWTECLKSLGLSGRLVTCGATSGPQVSLDLRHLFIKQQCIIGSTMGTLGELKKIHDIIARGELTVPIAKAFPFSEVAQAHTYLEKSLHFGKVVLQWAI